MRYNRKNKCLKPVIIVMLVIMAVGLLKNDHTTPNATTAINELFSVEDLTCHLLDGKYQTHWAKKRMKDVIRKVSAILEVGQKYPGFETWPRKGKKYHKCEYYRMAAWAKRIVFWNIFNGCDAQQHDVSLITFADLERLDRLNRIIKNWDGHISVAVHVKPNQVEAVSNSLNNIKITSLLRLHIVLDIAQTDIFPINYLRNIAINGSITDRVLVIDIDFVPSYGLRNTLQWIEIAEKEAKVVAAFEIVKNKNQSLPYIQTTDELLKEWDRGTAQPFKLSFFTLGHSGTCYDVWRTANEEYKVTLGHFYEPYIVVRRKNLPLYDERFVNRGMNKIAYFTTLNNSGYSLSVIPRVFILHHPHKTTVTNKYRSCFATRLEERVKRVALKKVIRDCRRTVRK